MRQFRILRIIAALSGAIAGLTVAQPASARPGSAQTLGPERQIMVMVKHVPDHFRPGGAYGGSYGGDLARSARERLARTIAHRYGLVLIDDWPMPMAGIDCFIMAVPEGIDTREMVDKVSRDSRVAWSQPVGLFETKDVGQAYNDPLYPAQPAARQWQLATLHRMATGKGIKVAVIDSGIDARHPDLSGQVFANRNFVSGRPMAAEQHGTGVAGIIAAKADNRLGLAGVAPGSRLFGLRACWQAARHTACDSFSLAKALYAAIDSKAEIINMSLSGPDDRLLRRLLEIANSRGKLVVAAVDDSQPGGGFPASARGVIPVSDSALAHARSGAYIAPGRNIPTTQPGGKWFLVNGTSYAAAHVSGLLALAKQKRPGLMPYLVTERDGFIDACATLARASPDCDCTCPALAKAAASSRP